MIQYVMTLYTMDPGDAERVEAFLRLQLDTLRVLAPSFDMDVGWDTVHVEEEEGHDDSND